MQKYYVTPQGEYSRLFADMLKQVHLLVGGAAGSGKSTVINGLVYTALYDSPAAKRFIFIDPKGTELDMYSNLPHCLYYAQTLPDCIKALEYTMQVTKARFSEMKRKRQRMYNGSDIYLIIDELMYLTNQAQIKRQAMQLLQDILVIARAARVHVIACTQNCTTQTIPATLRCNFDSRVGLRTTTAQDSRNVLGLKGCERFPNPTLSHMAYGYYMHGGEIELYQIPFTQESEINRLIDYWTQNKKPKIKLFH